MSDRYSIAFTSETPLKSEQLAAMARAMEQPEIRAFVEVVGLLVDVPKKKAARILKFVAESLEDQEQA